MTYRLLYNEEVVKSHIPELPKVIRTIIKRAVEERLTVDPIGFGKPLRYSLKGYRRLRVGNYRVVYRIDNAEHVVIIVAVQHRKDVYDE
ncbi:MAG: mRNA interferase RelE/StbE [Candidatus Dependentiae bacterium]|nr:mRNA interferase RelE/StbE [Candidatus Dependentiae bacterium]